MESVNIPGLWERGRMGATYLSNNINLDGSFNYQVNAMTGAIADDYNMLRHAGTLFECCEWVRATGDEGHRGPVEKGISYLLDHIHPWHSALCVVENDEIKLGGATLSLLAFCAHYRLTADPSHLGVMKRLATFILAMQKKDGDFCGRLSYPSGSPLPTRTRLYGEQALLALMHYHAISREQSIMQAARRYICFERLNPDSSEMVHPWLAKGLMAFYAQEQAEPVLEMIHHIGVNAIKILYGNVSRFKENWAAAGDRTTAKIVSIGEALVPFFEISLLLDDPEQLLMATKALRQVLAACFDNQIIEDRYINGMNLYGGLINSKTDHRIRIDFVQHFLSTITSLIRLSSWQPVLS